VDFSNRTLLGAFFSGRCLKKCDIWHTLASQRYSLTQHETPLLSNFVHCRQHPVCDCPGGSWIWILTSLPHWPNPIWWGMLQTWARFWRLTHYSGVTSWELVKDQMLMGNFSQTRFGDTRWTVERWDCRWFPPMLGSSLSLPVSDCLLFFPHLRLKNHHRLRFVYHETNKSLE
jgi:hypothetical protein